MLLQVMSEEKGTAFQAEPAGDGVQRIQNIGTDPWLVRDLNGMVSLKRADAETLKVTALDLNGYPGTVIGSAKTVSLQPATVYYLISR